MHNDLSSLLQDVWSHRAAIMAKATHVGAGRYSYMTNPFTNKAVRMINQMMGAKEHSLNNAQLGQNLSESAIDDFCGRLERTVNHYGGGSLQLEYLSHNKGAFVIDENVRGSTLARFTTTRPSNAFFCFRFRQSSGAIMNQMYINFKAQHRVDGINSLLKRVRNMPAVSTLKVAAPWCERIDNVIVEYNPNLADFRANATSAVLINRKIRELAQKHPEYFNAQHRALSKPVRGAPGVSIGVAPPPVSVKRRNKDEDEQYYVTAGPATFGIYRAQLIFMALERTVAPTEATKKSRWNNSVTQSRLKVRVKTYFSKAGLDIDKPWEQDARKASQLKDYVRGRQRSDALASIENRKYVPDWQRSIAQNNAAKAEEKFAQRVHRKVFNGGHNVAHASAFQKLNTRRA